ncbi:Elf4 domain-containing protein [Chloropicon roscoffensis]|uniref:Elf4 domain-containing protein n=1 Tax=Chloropicon roscoffensis TaxID=1461544 RepID=A0AAX4PA32_9CHLO|mmetsp:Transcript_11466/g.34881  ORF Transcript_11466/g.34881 Transcript_11466/m.34881 type:complete len:111 (-) Transcript_11466:170-502(-)
MNVNAVLQPAVQFQHLSQEVRTQNLLQSIKTKEMREPLLAVQNILAQNRTLAYDIVLNQHMPTVERLTHSNLLIQRFDGNLKQVVEIYKKMGEDVQAMVDELRQQEQQEG